MEMRRIPTITEYLEAWERRREEFRKLPKEEQKRVAIQRLIKTGVLNSDGTPKENICTID